MKRAYFIMLVLFPLSIYCQSIDTLRLNKEEIEAIFLKQNLVLIAEKMNISIADAEIIQAKLWDNPTLSVSDVNVWANNSQREILREIGASNDNTQFALELSQLITTAGKRRKEVAVQKVSKEMAIQQFGETLRGMKTELRKSINEIVYLQNYEIILSEQVDVLARLIDSYEKQVKSGNLSKVELLRLQSSFLEMENEIYLLKIELNSQLKTIKSLLNLSPVSNIFILSDAKSNPFLPLLQDLYSLAADNRPDLKLQKLQTDRFKKTLNLEKAKSIPDITLSANYDRYAGIWKNYFGFGLSFDLPVFNRNQGNFKVAAFSLEQSRFFEQQIQNEVFNEIAEAYNHYEQSLIFFRKISNNEILSELDDMLEVYAKNLLNRNISMLEFIDFMESYQKSKQIFFEMQKSVKNNFEELQYVVGIDLK